MRRSNSDSVSNHVKREVVAVDICSYSARFAALKFEMDAATAANDNCLPAYLTLNHIHMKCAKVKLCRIDLLAPTTLKAGGRSGKTSREN